MSVIGLCLLCAVASFVAGFLAGDKYGTQDTERRWTEAVARAADARDRARELQADCQRGRIGDAENIGRLLSLIESLKRGYCWCSVLKRKDSESHAPACIAAAKAVGETL
jgi:hypothetical protein